MTDPKRRSGPPKALVRATDSIAMAIAGRRWIPVWAVIHHRGRRSGTDYATPIAVIPTLDPGVILIGLPWGPKTNWARNVVAAGGARLRWRGSEHEVAAPRIIGTQEAVALAKGVFRPVVRRMPAAIAMTRAGGGS